MVPTLSIMICANPFKSGILFFGLNPSKAFWFRASEKSNI